MFGEKNKIKMIMCIICQLLYNIFNVFFAWIIMQITDSLVEGDRDIFIGYMGVAIVGVGCQILFNFLSVCIQNKIVSESMNLVRTKSLYGILKSEGRCLPTGEMAKNISYFTNELELFENSYLRMWINIINSVMLLILSGGMIFEINRIMLLVVIAMMILIMLTPWVLSNGLQKANVIYLDSNKEMIKKTEEFLNGFEVIKSFFIENKIACLYDKIVKKCINDKRRLENKMGVSNAVTSVMSILIMLVTFVIGGYLILNSVLSVGALLAVIQLISNMISPLTDIIYCINEINSVKEIKEKVVELLKKADERDNKIDLLPLGKKIEIKNLSYSYLNQGEDVLKKVNVELEKGKMYAVVGENGCGKSTFAKIISGYYTDYSGEIIIDGNDIRTISEYRIRNRIVYMNQKNFLFDASPKDNCSLFGKYDINMDMVKKMDSNELLTKKYSTTMMSGGERQKISFIRDFGKDSDIVICDEADSAMDILAKKHFMELLKSDKEKIKVIITHNVDTGLKEYDKILFFKDGILAEKGNFDELFKKRGEFYMFYNRQVV